MRNYRIGRDPYHGWRFYVQGCPDPFRRGRVMFNSARRKGWDRRIATAVAFWVVVGSERARRYLWDREWSPSAHA